MFRKLIITVSGFFIVCTGTFSYAGNLIDVYQAALSSSPELRQAEADNNAAGEAIGSARSALLPQVSMSAGTAWSEGMRRAEGQHSRASDGTLSLSQSLFNMAAWQTLSQQEKQATLQRVNYRLAQQTLLSDTATAYFSVLEAIDTLSYTEAEKMSVEHQLAQTTQKFKVGSIAVTDLRNVQARYDQVLSAEVTARNSVDNSIETLREVSGLTWTRLATLDTARFAARKLHDVKAPEEQAEKNSLQLLSARLSRELAKSRIDSAEAGHLPTVSLSASMGLSGSKSRQDDNYGKSITGSQQVGISVSVPLYSGGGVTSAVKQSEYAWVSASERLDSVHRTLIKSVRSAFNNVNAAVSRIKSDEQTVISAQSSLEATQNGYQAGTRTMLDVLDATTMLYSARRSLSADRYDYLLAGLTLKSTQGLLSIDDLRACNAFLGKEIDISASE